MVELFGIPVNPLEFGGRLGCKVLLIVAGINIGNFSLAGSVQHLRIRCVCAWGISPLPESFLLLIMEREDVSQGAGGPVAGGIVG
jgi:hypothetical protein